MTQNKFALDNSPRRFHPTFLVILSLSLLSFAVYGQVIHHQFLNLDDDLFIFGNPHIRQGLTLDGIKWAFSADLFYDSAHADYWRPVTFLSHMADIHFFGFNAGFHHLTNLLLHTASSVLLFLAFKQMTGELWKSAFVSALFALHPLQAEAVAWIAARKDILSTFFAILTILVYGGYVRKPSLKKNLVLNLLFILGLMSKPALVILPVLLLLLDFWPLQRVTFATFKKADFKRLLVEKACLFLISIGMGILVRCPEFGILSKATWSFQYLLMPVNYVFYLQKAIAPSNLAIHSFLSVKFFSSVQITSAFLLMVVISALIVRHIKKYPYLFSGWLWFLIAFLPTIGLIRADRFASFPLIGIWILVSWGVSDLSAFFKMGKLPIFVAAFLLSVYAVVSHLQASYWRDNITLFGHVLKVDRNNSRGHNNFGLALAAEGREREAGEHFAKALEIQPDFAQAHNNLGVVLFNEGKFNEAETCYSKAIKINPRDVIFHVNLGEVLLKEGKIGEAIAVYVNAVKIQPDFSIAHSGLGEALMQNNRREEAIVQFKEALQIDPHNELASHSLVLALKNG